MEYLNYQKYLKCEQHRQCYCPCGEDIGMHPAPDITGPYCGAEECAEYLEDHPEWYCAENMRHQEESP